MQSETKPSECQRGKQTNYCPITACFDKTLREVSVSLISRGEQLVHVPAFINIEASFPVFLLQPLISRKVFLPTDKLSYICFFNKEVE